MHALTRVPSRLLHIISGIINLSSTLVIRRFGRRVVIVDGVRTPFVHAGGVYSDLRPHQLASDVIRMLIKRCRLPKDVVDHVVIGCVNQDISTSNVAREASLLAGLPADVTAHTVAMACISSNQAIVTGATQIATGQSECIICGGVEQMTDIPIRHSRQMRKLLLQARKAKGWSKRLKLLPKLLRPSIYYPDVPEIVEFSTGEHLGHAADRLSASFSIGRKEQDDFAYRSHQLTARAREFGQLSDMEPYHVPGEEIKLDRDVGVTADREVMSRLEPYFVQPHGTVTIGNTAFLTDGAAACLLMSETKALNLGYRPKVSIRSFAFTSQDPKNQLLMGQTYSIAAVLKRAGLSLADMDVIELHEAFAGQVLANIKAMSSDWYCKTYLNTAALGEIPMTRLNLWGGAISLGHPFSASGVRTIMAATNRLHSEDGTLALIALCASGGQGHAMILERYI